MPSRSKSNKFKYHPNMKKHQILKEAMKYLDTKNRDHKGNKYEFICQCINKVITNDPISFKDKSGLLSLIEERLYPHDTLNSWLFVKHHISPNEQNSDQGRKLQQTRKAWMQSMYEEFLAKDE